MHKFKLGILCLLIMNVLIRDAPSAFLDSGDGAVQLNICRHVK